MSTAESILFLGGGGGKLCDRLASHPVEILVVA